MTRAVRLLERAAQINPADYKPAALLINAYRSVGRHSDCKTAARKTVELAERDIVLHSEDSRPAVLGALALLELGERDRAKDWAARAQAIENEDPVSLYNLACLYSRLGESEAAFDLLERAVANGRPFWKDWIENDSDLDGLRNHPRYAQLVVLLKQQFPAR
jgi:adenylate cyclase